jgi:hypothetical protein
LNVTGNNTVLIADIYWRKVLKKALTIKADCSLIKGLNPVCEQVNARNSDGAYALL